MHVYVCESINCECRKYSQFAINRYSQLKLVLWYAATGKGHHITKCTLRINDTSLSRTLQRGPAVSIIQRFHCTCTCTCTSCMDTTLSHCPLLKSNTTTPQGWMWAPTHSHSDTHTYSYSHTVYVCTSTCTSHTYTHCHTCIHVHVHLHLVQCSWWHGCRPHSWSGVWRSAASLSQWTCCGPQCPSHPLCQG